MRLLLHLIIFTGTSRSAAPSAAATTTTNVGNNNDDVVGDARARVESALMAMLASIGELEARLNAEQRARFLATNANRSTTSVDAQRAQLTRFVASLAAPEPKVCFFLEARAMFQKIPELLKVEFFEDS